MSQANLNLVRSIYAWGRGADVTAQTAHTMTATGYS